MMKTLITLLLFGVGLVNYNSNSQGTICENTIIRHYGVAIIVADVEKAKKFYSSILGFEIEKETSEFVLLRDAKMPFYLVKGENNNTAFFKTQSHAKLVLEVDKMLPIIERLKSNGVKFVSDDINRNGVGVDIRFEDPFSNQLSVMAIQNGEEFKSPRIYNTGIHVSGSGKAEEFYTKILGFEVYTRNYLPSTLPMKHRDESFAFVIHFKDDLEKTHLVYPKNSQTIMLYKSSNLKSDIEQLRACGVSFLFTNPKIRDNYEFVAFKDSEGIISELIELEK